MHQTSDSHEFNPGQSRRPPSRNGLFSRRELIQVGSLGLLGLPLARLLNAEQAAATPTNRRTAQNCIFIVQYGGASHIDTWDLKPSAPDEIRGPYKPIATRIPGLEFGELLPQLAQWADRCTLIRSMTHSTADHDGGMHVCMTGHSRPVESTPYFGAVVARFRPATQLMPSYVWLQNLDRDVVPRYLSGGSLGPDFAPLRVGTNEDNPSAAGFRMTGFDPPEGVSLERLAARRELLDDLEPVSGSGAMGDGRANMRRCQERALDLVTGPAARSAFDLGQETDAARESYGRHPLGQNLLLARRLIEAGVRLVTVNAWLGVPEGEKFLVTQGWDMHGAEVQKCGIFSTSTFGLGFALPRFDQAVAALLADLDARGMLESTLVVIVGEFGRTPKIASNPYPGRDHWPNCYSALLAGGPIRRGLVHGASDKVGAYVEHHPVTPEAFHATLFHALGIAHDTRFGPDGFSQRISDGEPIQELFA